MIQNPGKWKMSIDISQEWKRAKELLSEDKFEEAKTLVVTALKKYFKEIEGIFEYDDYAEFEITVDSMENSKDIDEFDTHTSTLYDWADWHKVWINTF